MNFKDRIEIPFECLKVPLLKSHLQVERKTPLILAGCEEMHAEVLAWAATRSEDPAHKPGDATPAIQRAYVVNTR